jgi:hypothetical protein
VTEWACAKKVVKMARVWLIDTGDKCATFPVPKRDPPMSRETQIIRAEIPEIARILENECWLESERRGYEVGPHDEVIRRRVAEIILGGAGAYLREKCCEANFE